MKAVYQGREYKAGQPFQKRGDVWVILEGEGGAMQVLASEVTFGPGGPGWGTGEQEKGLPYRVRYNDRVYGAGPVFIDAEEMERVDIGTAQDPRPVRAEAVEGWTDAGGRPISKPEPSYRLTAEGERIDLTSTEPTEVEVGASTPRSNARRMRRG